MTRSPFFPPAGARLAPTPWLAVGATLADFAFETDPLGRFTAFGPGRALGRPTAALMGQEFTILLAGGDQEEAAVSANELRSIITTICVECVAWHGRLRLAGPDGALRLYRLSLAPRREGSEIAGTYGLLFDLESPDLVLPDRHAERTARPGFSPGTMLDVETGLWSRATFATEITRRLDRLDVEEQPGTLLYIGFGPLNAKLRPAVALRLAEELRDIMRPTDLLGRVGDLVIGLWCDGMDHLTGGERAAKFCTTLPALLPERTLLNVGVVPRWPGRGEDAETVMEHAAMMLRQLQNEDAPAPGAPSPPRWRVWQSD